MAWNKVGQVLKSKKGSFYIKVEKDLTLAAGSSLQLQDPRAGFKRMAETGKISEEEAEAKAAKLPEFLKYDIFEVTDK